MADQQQDRERDHDQDREGAEPAVAEGPGPVDGASDDGGAEGGAEGGEGGQEDVKDRFQEALARKRAQHADVGTGGPGAASKIRGARGPASSQRSFRRKSGG